MAKNIDLYNFCKNNLGKAFDMDGQWGAQCVDLIVKLNQEFGLGLNTGGLYAKDIYHNNVPSNVRKVQGDPNNDANAKKIWDTLPLGAIVFFTNADAGHVAIKSGGWCWCLEQNYNTNGWGGPITNDNIAGWIESGGAGFSGAWVINDGASASDGVAEAKKDKTGKSLQPNIDIGRAIKSLDLTQIKKEIENMLNEIVEVFDNRVYQTSNDLYTNNILNVDAEMNTLKVTLSEDFINGLKDNLFKGLDESNNKNINWNGKSRKGSPVNLNPSSIPSDESTDEKKVELITKICLQYEPQANSFGITGLVGNFVGESNINPKTFEADFTGLQSKNPDKNTTPTVEDLFYDWNYFQNRVYPNYVLDEGTYLYEGKHWIGVGLGQWTGLRTKGLYDYAKSKNIDMWTVKTQMLYAFEGDGANSNILKQCLRNSESTKEGVDNAYVYWERAHVPSSLPARYSGADKWFNFIDKIVKESKVKKN